MLQVAGSRLVHEQRVPWAPVDHWALSAIFVEALGVQFPLFIYFFCPSHYNSPSGDSAERIHMGWVHT